MFGDTADAVLRCWRSPCDHAALCGVYGDRAVQGFRRIFTAFFGLLFGVEAFANS